MARPKRPVRSRDIVSQAVSVRKPRRSTSVYTLVWLLLVTRLAFAADAPSIPRAFIVPHTHWEGAVFKTREEYLDIGLPHILKALYLLKKYPEYRFALDQMCYVRPFLERYPSEVPAFRQFLREGRLQIVGGTDAMHDTNIPSGESIVRQFLLAKLYFRDQLGYDVTTGWAIDTFGHNAQMPQILKLAGMKSYWFSRGAPAATPSEFLWQGIDGTNIPAFRLPYSYFQAYGLPANEVEFNYELRDRFQSLAPYGHGPEHVLLDGSDVSEPEGAMPPMLDEFNRSVDEMKAQFASPAEFETLVARRGQRPIVGGEFNPVFQGVYSSRIELKQTMREMEQELMTAERLSVIASVAGGVTDPATIEAAWEPVLFNQEHDVSSGTIVDKVYANTMAGYDRAHRLAEHESIRDSQSILANIDTSGKGMPLIVFNSLGWVRTDVAEATVPFSDPGIAQFALYDATGEQVPIQALEVSRYEDGGIREARIVFIARNIPSMGYAVYHVVPSSERMKIGSTGTRDGFFAKPGPQGAFEADLYSDALNRTTVENEIYRASFDLWTGAMTSLVLKENHWEALAGSGNVVAQEPDGGDLWELNGSLGTGIVSVRKPIGLPRANLTRWSSDFVGAGASTMGPVFSEYHIRHPFGQGQFSTRVRLYNGLRRIDIHTEILNQDSLVRYRVVFPTAILTGTAIHEIPFGALERSQNQEFPAQNWIDFGDGRRGLSLINRGIPGNNVTDGKLMLSLMRSATLGNYPESDLDPSTEGLGIGKTYSFDYALIVHTRDWRAATPWRAGMEFNSPLIVRTAAPHQGKLPPRWGLIEITNDNVVLSALKLSRGGASVLRIYEASGRPEKNVRIHFSTDINQVHETNLLEDEISAAESNRGDFYLDLRPFEIKTFKLRILPPT